MLKVVLEFIGVKPTVPTALSTKMFHFSIANDVNRCLVYLFAITDDMGWGWGFGGGLGLFTTEIDQNLNMYK